MADGVQSLPHVTTPPPTSSFWVFPLVFLQAQALPLGSRAPPRWGLCIAWTASLKGLWTQRATVSLSAMAGQAW